MIEGSKQANFTTKQIIKTKTVVRGQKYVDPSSKCTHLQFICQNFLTNEL